MHKMTSAQETSCWVRAEFRCRERSTPISEHTLTAPSEAGDPPLARPPAERTSTFSRLDSPNIRLSNPSAIALRQVFPVQTRRTFVADIVPKEYQKRRP